MTHYHPDSQWLSEYAAGTLTDSQALCISAHLAYCEHCKQQTTELTEIGAMLFYGQPSADTSPDALHSVLKQIQAQTPATAQTSPQTASIPQTQLTSGDAEDYANLPAAVQKLVPGGFSNLRWQKIGSLISIAKLNNLGDERNVSLHKLQPGGSVSNHDHRGREITVVLRGSFSDQDGQYFPGDFLIREPGETHRPSASNNEECLCLAVCDAPVKFTGMFARLLNPLMAYQHKH